MVDSDKKKIQYPLKLNKNKTVIRGETTLVLLKQIFDKRTEKSYDWAFATNQSDINLDYIIPTYKNRWRIETGFRVQDEAHIMSKSADARIRFFFFAYEKPLRKVYQKPLRRFTSQTRMPTGIRGYRIKRGVAL